MAVMGQVMALTCCDPLTRNSTIHRHAPREREKRVLFHHHGHHVCMRTLLFLHGIARWKFQAIKDHYLSEGLIPQTHGHTGCIVPNALVQRDIQQILSFVSHYPVMNAILLPGWIPGYDVQLLSSTTTTKAVWRLYQETHIPLRAGCRVLHFLQGETYCTICYSNAWTLKYWNHLPMHIHIDHFFIVAKAKLLISR